MMCLHVQLPINGEANHIYTWSVKGKEKKLNFLCKELA